MGSEKANDRTATMPVNKKTLLERYNIPIDHLSFEYISQSTEAKELERIVLILRSGEEGSYPDLTKHAEARLAVIKPESSVLRKSEPILTRAMLAPDRREKLDDDMSEWMNEMKLRDKDLSAGRSMQFESLIPQPDIREMKFNERNKEQKSLRNQDQKKSISACDYAAWDKYDADTESNRIDLQNEKHQAEIKRIQKKKREKEEKAKQSSREATVDKLALTGTELNVMAGESRERGNEAFRAGDYDEALQFYNSSIAIAETTQAYNNRAMTYIKLQRYNDAVRDCDKVISIENTNTKAFLRRALALEHLEKKAQALTDYETVLKSEPMNTIVIAAINRLRGPSNSKKIKIKIEEEQAAEETSVEKGLESTKMDSYHEHSDKSKSVQDKPKQNCSSSSVGASTTSHKTKSLPRHSLTTSGRTSHLMNSQVCFCNNAPSSSQCTSPMPHLRDSYCSNALEKSIKLPKLQSIFTDTKLSYEKSTGVIIEEIPNEPPEKSIGSTNDTISNDKPQEDETRKDIPVILGSGDTPQKIIRMPTDLTERLDKKGTDHREEIMEDRRFDKISTPYEFVKLWHSLKNDPDLVLRAELLKSLAPENINSGNKMDGEMFSIIIQCFGRHFCTPEHYTQLHRFIQELTRVERFLIMCMFMDVNDRKVLRDVFLFLESNDAAPDDISELRMIYGVSM